MIMHQASRLRLALNRRRIWIAALAVVLALVLAACAQNSTNDVELGTEAAMGRYIVVLDAEADRTNPGLGQGRAADVARAYGLAANRTYGAALVGFAAFVPEARLAALRADPRVAYVESDDPVQLYDQSIPTGIDRIFASSNPDLDIDGTDDLRVDVDVAVIDTGVDFEHPDLNVAGGVDCTVSSGGGPPWGRNYYCSETEGTGGDDDHYHGTHVAGTIGALDNGFGVVGVAPGARIWAVKVLNGNGSGYESGIVAGIDWIAAHGSIEVANMSLGGSGHSQAEFDAIESAVAAGVAFAVAAGNDNDDARNYSPAKFANALTVSALADFDGVPGGNGSSTCRTDEDDTLANFSNWGPAVDIAAPGVCILSTFPIEQGEYGTISGTSMASPHVAGALAVLASTSPPAGRNDVFGLYDALTTMGNTDWVDDSGDNDKEPLLDMGGGAVNSAPVVDIAAPLDGAKFTSGDGITLSGTANDAEDGGITARIVWESDLDGPIGSGGSVTTTTIAPLSDGTHEITASATDDGGRTGTASIVITVGTVSDPEPTAITLGVTLGDKKQGTTPVTLTWSGAVSDPVEVHIGGSLYETQDNDGQHTYRVRGGGTYTFEICETGGAPCSNAETVSF